MENFTVFITHIYFSIIIMLWGNSVMKHYEVVGAIIEYDGKILCMQRPVGKFDYTSLKYEFPGGKVEAGETNSEALMRELREEMEYVIDIKESDYFDSVTHVYPDFEITMHCYLCHPTTDIFVRKEHVDHVWLVPSEMMTLDWAAADLPIVEKIVEEYK